MNGALAPNRNEVCSACIAFVLLHLLPERGPPARLMHERAGGPRSGKISPSSPSASPGRAQCLDLVFRGVVAARNDGAGVAHAAARRGGAAGDETDHRLPGPRGLDE